MKKHTNSSQKWPLLECCMKKHTNSSLKWPSLECCMKKHTNSSQKWTLPECCMKKHTNSSLKWDLTRMLYEKTYKLFLEKAPGSNGVRKIIQKLICMDDFDDAIRKITQIYPPVACLRRNLQRRRNGARRAPDITRGASSRYDRCQDTNPSRDHGSCTERRAGSHYSRYSN